MLLLPLGPVVVNIILPIFNLFLLIFFIITKVDLSLLSLVFFLCLTSTCFV